VKPEARFSAFPVFRSSRRLPFVVGRADIGARQKPSSQSAALLAWEAARTMARLSSRSTSSQEPI
jgi:hypothetical protein